MKNLIILLFTLVVITSANTQPCPEYGISFYNQFEIDNFQNNYPECTDIIGSVTIMGDDITNLYGLSQINSISGFLYIQACPNLSNLEGLEGLITIGGKLEIYNNDALTSIEGLSGLTSIGSYLIIKHNDTLLSLTGLEGLTTIEEFVNIWNNPELTYLTGLNGLTSIETWLNIAFNNSLINLTGLQVLTSVGNLKIEYNESLTSLTGLEGLSSISESLDIQYNNSLTNLTSLQGLSSIGELLYIEGNDALTSLIGLDNAKLDSIDYLSINFNSNLEECDIYSICQYIAAPNGTINIYGNSPGCNSLEELEEHCLTQVEEKYANSRISIFPNPSENIITISSSVLISDTQLSILNVNGKKVFEKQIKNNETQIDISTLPRGVYFVWLKNEETVEVGKIVKE